MIDGKPGWIDPELNRQDAKDAKETEEATSPLPLSLRSSISRVNHPRVACKIAVAHAAWSGRSGGITVSAPYWISRE